MILGDMMFYSIITLIFLNIHAIAVPQLTMDPMEFRRFENGVRLIRENPGQAMSTPPIPVFRYVYLDKNGLVSPIGPQQNKSPKQVEIAGSPRTTAAAMYATASYIANITRHISLELFHRIASETSVGIFSASEKLTVFPEYSYLSNGDCGGSCEGQCVSTCTGDGRKIEDLTGIGGRLAVILDDNIMCSKNDPYQGKENILAHELTHTIHQYALTDAQKSKILNAYRHAKQRKTWVIKSYAMSNVYEYFAEGATVFFGVNSYNRLNTGGMNMCGSGFCSTEQKARTHLMRLDGHLFDILSEVFTNNRPSLLSNLSVCPTAK